jgi:hypothetical protein
MAGNSWGDISLNLVTRFEAVVICLVTNRQAVGAAHHWRIQNATQMHLTCAPFFMEN